MKANTLLLGIVALLCGAAVFLSSWMFSALPGQDYGSDTMPRATGILGMIAGLALIVEGRRHAETFPRLELSEWTGNRLRILMVIAALVGVVFYIFASPYLGFVITSFVIQVVLMIMVGVKIPWAVLISAASTILIYFVFSRLLLVPLPLSGLTPWF